MRQVTTGWGCVVNEQARQEALQESNKALELMRKAELSRDEQDAVVADCVENFDKYVNPGLLECRKSVSTDYTAVEWRDEGNVFYDIHGKEFIDCLGGFGIYMLGHRHPTVKAAVEAQLGHQALHSQELLDPMRAYASKLIALVTPGKLQYSFFCNSGTEACEGALKLAKLYAYRRKRPRHSKGIISTTRRLSRQVDGQSRASAGKREWREPFEPMVPHVRFIPYGDADALDKELKICDQIGLDIAAFIAEPVQGEAGAIVPPDDFFPKVREICDKWRILFICDEVPDRHGAHRHLVGHRALGRGSRHHDHGQGPRRRGHTGRQLVWPRPRSSSHDREPLHPHHDVRRQPHGHRRR